MVQGLPRKKRSSTNRSQRPVITVVIISVILLGAFVYLYWADANPTAHLVIDFRFHLTITNAATNKNITIPAQIGVSGGIWLNHTLDGYGQPGYAPLSTRDTSGTLYVQSVAPRLFLLSEFFSIWGQAYNATCVGYGSGAPYCSSAQPPIISNGNAEYCLSYDTPPTENGKSWDIVFNTALGAGLGCK
jgi:hypothetical protein